MNYVTAGQASIDRVVKPDGTCLGTNLGGPGVFAYTGVRIWDDSVKMILNIAEDFYEYYGDWLRSNHVDQSALETVYDHTHSSDLIYEEDGSYSQSARSVEELVDRAAEYGWTNVRPAQIEAHTRNAQAFYLFVEPLYLHFWKQLREIRNRNDFELMWEIGIAKGGRYDRGHILNILELVRPEMASMNHNEARDFFGEEDREEIFHRIHTWKIPMFFYRAGSSGSYLLHRGKSWFVPSIDLEGAPYVDATGCGNSSTAAAMYAWRKTRNPVMTAIIANVTGGINVSCAGIIKSFDSALRETAFRTAAEVYDQYTRDHPDYCRDGYPHSADQVLALLREKR